MMNNRSYIEYLSIISTEYRGDSENYSEENGNIWYRERK